MGSPRKRLSDEDMVRLFLKGSSLMGVTLRAFADGYGDRKLVWMTTEEGQRARDRVERIVRRALKRALKQRDYYMVGGAA